MDDESPFPFADDDLAFASMNRRRKNRRPKDLRMLLAEKPGDFYYNKKGTSSRVEPPDQPLNILLIRQASIYKLDGSNTIEPLVGRVSFKDAYILGSFNGLVALYLRPDCFCLLNPTTGKKNLIKLRRWRQIRTLWDIDFHMLGLCHDSVNGEYKAVIFYSKSEDQRFTVADFKHQRCVFKTQSNLPCFKAFPSGPVGIVLKGVPYWMCEADECCLIYYFDSKTDEFLEGPCLPHRTSNYRLGSLDGKLIASLATPQRGTLFWALHEANGVGCSWSCLFVIPELVCTFSTLSRMSGAELLVHHAETRLIAVYNLCDQSVHPLSKSLQMMLAEWPQCDIATPLMVAYVPSSVDPF